jgi:FMN-dependent NADH-azoreductase
MQEQIGCFQLTVHNSNLGNILQMKELNVLLITSSARLSNSVTRRFAGEMLDALRHEHAHVTVRQRDVSVGLPFVDEEWVTANFTPEEQRTDEHRAALSTSNSLVEELKLADIVLIAAPIYNFGIPASLKSWIDQIARVGLTFNYTENGPVGTLQNKKAYIVIASGGTQVGSEIDFSSGYLRHVLGFIGINDVTIISAEKFDEHNVQATTSIRARIADLAQHAA